MNTNIVPHFFAALALALAGSALFAYNAANSTEEVVGEKYAVSYSYCARTTYGHKTSHCAEWKPAVEYRVNTVVKGPLFNYSSYKVVGK